MRQQFVENFVARIHQSQPEFIAAVRGDAVRESGKVVDKDFRLSVLRTTNPVRTLDIRNLWSALVQPNTVYPVFAGFYYQHIRLIRTYGDAIRKRQMT